MQTWAAPALAVALIIALAPNAPAYARLPHLKDVAYPQARTRLIALGYTPVRITHRASWVACPYEEDCRQYPELLQCSGTGIALCDFMYRNRKSRRYVVVTTYGEDRRKVYSLSYATRYDMAGWRPGLIK